MKRGERRENFFFLLSFLFVPQKEEIEHKQINISEMFTYQFLPSLLFSPTPTGCSRPSPSCRRSPTPKFGKQVQYLLNNGWTPCIEFEDPAHAYTDGHGWAAWTPPSTPVTTTTDTGLCGSSPCTAANNPDEVLAEVKACVKCVPELLRPRAPASTTSSKCNAPPSWCTDRSWTRWRVVPEMSPTDKSKFA